MNEIITQEYAEKLEKIRSRKFIRVESFGKRYWLTA